MAERHNWGRLRAEKWKRSVHLVLSLWEGWCAFPNETQQLFTQTFENPPKPKKEEQTEESLKKTGKWKTVDASEQRGFLPVSTKPDEEEAAEDVDGDAMDDDAEMLDAEMDSDIDGVPMDSDDGEPMDQDPSTSVQVVAT
ncbi:hypothetical protein F4780DRAFT_785045 [Xylariomycetidae sp. FL0641]|nr:hypothetical protein F4780DRAFT_785045 [Xylariomycetidae sp. FL0641]